MSLESLGSKINRKEKSSIGHESLDAVQTRSIQLLRDIEADPLAYIDEGGAARVYQLPQGTCMKVFRNRQAMAAGSSICQPFFIQSSDILIGA